jgi:hypothetical protein
VTGNRPSNVGLTAAEAARLLPPRAGILWFKLFKLLRRARPA